MCSPLLTRIPSSHLLNNHQQEKTLETTERDPPSHRQELATERSRKVAVGMKSVPHLPGGVTHKWEAGRHRGSPTGVKELNPASGSLARGAPTCFA